MSELIDDIKKVVEDHTVGEWEEFFDKTWPDRLVLLREWKGRDRVNTEYPIVCRMAETACARTRQRFFQNAKEAGEDTESVAWWQEAKKALRDTKVVVD